MRVCYRNDLAVE